MMRESNVPAIQQEERERARLSSKKVASRQPLIYSLKGWRLRVEVAAGDYLKRMPSRPLSRRGLPTCVPLKTDSKL